MFTYTIVPFNSNAWPWLLIRITWKRGFPGIPVINTSPINARGAGSIYGWGAKLLYASQPKQKTEKNIVTNSIRTLKMVHVKKFFLIKSEIVSQLTWGDVSLLGPQEILGIISLFYLSVTLWSFSVNQMTMNPHCLIGSTQTYFYRGRNPGAESSFSWYDSFCELSS